MKLYKIDIYKYNDLIESDSSTHEDINNCASCLLESERLSDFIKYIEDFCEKNSCFFLTEDFCNINVRNDKERIIITCYHYDFNYICRTIFIITSEDFKIINNNGKCYDDKLYNP